MKKLYLIEFFQEKGGYFGIVGAVAVAIAALFSYFLHILVDPSFNIISFAVSDLATGPPISGVIYSIGLIIASFSQYPLYFSLIYYLRQDLNHNLLIKVTELGAIISIVSHNIVSLIPSVRSIFVIFTIHGTAAGIHYVAGSTTLILYGIIEILSKKVSKIYIITSFISGTLYGLVLLFFVFGISKIFLNYSVQWIAFSGVISWSLLQGILLIRVEK